MLIYFVCFLLSTPPPQKKKKLFRQQPCLPPHYPHVLWGEKHYIKSPPDFQRFIEERSPSGVKGHKDAG